MFGQTQPELLERRESLAAFSFNPDLDRCGSEHNEHNRLNQHGTVVHRQPVIINN